jgi:branched-chain amino acid transport system permease protein
VLGALILEPAQLSLAYQYGASRLYLVLYASVFLLVILLMPRGIIPSVRDLIARRRAMTGPAAPAAQEKAVAP